MITAFAQIISFLFNPVLLLVFVPLFLMYKTTGDTTTAMVWTGYTMIFLLIMTFFIFYGVQKKMFTDMDVSKRTQRPLLFGVSMVLALIYLFGLYLLNGPAILMVVIFGVIVGIFLVSLINLKIKASIHVATTTALLVAMALVYSDYYLLLLVLVPLVAWSRVHIHRHTLSETIAGGIFGLLLTLGIYFLARIVLL